MEVKRRKRSRKAGTVEEARRILWKVLERAEDLADAEDMTPADTLRTLHAVSQGVAAYARVCEVADLEARLAVLEAADKERAEIEGQEATPGRSLRSSA